MQLIKCISKPVMVILNQVWWPASQQGNFLIVLSLSPFRLLHWFASSSKGARVFQSRVLKPLFKKGEIRQTKNQDKSKPRQDKTWNNYKYKRVQIWGYVNGWKGEGIIKSAGLARESQFCTLPPSSCWCTKLSFLSLLVIYDSDDSESMFLIERLVRSVQARSDLLPDISDFSSSL